MKSAPIISPSWNSFLFRDANPNLLYNSFCSAVGCAACETTTKDDDNDDDDEDDVKIYSDMFS